MFAIIESYRNYFELNKEPQTKKLRVLLELLIANKTRIPTIDLFNAIYQLLDLKQEKTEIFENVGPMIELKFGDNQCCGYKFGVDSVAGTLQMTPTRCVRQKLPGFLYCRKHHENEIKPCWRCKLNYKRDIIHQFGWEHFGNIFESGLRERTWIKSAPLLGVDCKQIITFSQKTFGRSATIQSEKTAPVPVPTVRMESMKPPITKLTKNEIQQLSLHLLQHMLSNNCIKVSAQHPISEIKLFDVDDDLVDDGKFIYKMVAKKRSAIGIRKNGDSVVMKESIMDLKLDSQLTDDKIEAFIKINLYLNQK
jgi:hypothetical protein